MIREKYNLIAEIFLYVLAAYIPFQAALNLFPDVDLASGRVLILIFFGVWLVKSFIARDFSWIKNKIALPLILFFVVALISVLAAQNQWWGLRKILVFVSIFPLFFIVAGLIDNTIKARRLVWVMISSAVLAAVIALGQFFAQFILGSQAVFNLWSQKIAPIFYGKTFAVLVAQDSSWFVNVGGKTLMRAIGLFPDPHMLAFFIGLSLPLALALFSWEKKRKNKIFLFAVCGLLAMALLLTFSRGGYLGLSASILIFGFLVWQRLGRQVKILIASIFFLLVAVSFFVDLPIFGRFSAIFDITEGSNLGRVKIWQESLIAAKENPITGVGLGNYPLSLNFNENYRSAVTSHNLYLDILVETGIFGLLAWLWFLGGAAKEALAGLRQKSNLVFFISVGLAGSLIYFFIHSFFETAIFNPTVLVWLMIVCGLAASVNKFQTEARQDKKTNSLSFPRKRESSLG